MKKTKKILGTVSILASLTMFTGCSGVMNGINSALGIPTTPQEFISKNNDKVLVTAMANKYFKKTDNTSTSYVGNDYFKLNKDLIEFDEMISQGSGADEVGRRFENDNVVNEYKKVIDSRGNTYKLYNNNFNKYLYQTAFNIQNLKTYERPHKYVYDWTPAIIEYDANGNIVSAMIRTYEYSAAYNDFSSSSAPIKVETDIIFLTGYKARSLKNKISNARFEENEL